MQWLWGDIDKKGNFLVNIYHFQKKPRTNSSHPKSTFVESNKKDLASGIQNHIACFENMILSNDWCIGDIPFPDYVRKLENILKYPSNYKS